MLTLRKLAITGGLSCGKSAVCRILKQCAAYVVSADEIVHQLLSSDKNIGQKVIKLLGPDIIVNQKIDRSLIAKKVFRDADLLKDLEEIIHPPTYEEIEKAYRKQAESSSPPSLFAAEIPLLYESGGDENYNHVLCVVADQELCSHRFQESTGNTKQEFDRRAASQLDLMEKAKRADYVIMNNGSLEDLEQITKEFYKDLMEP